MSSYQTRMSREYPFVIARVAGEFGCHENVIMDGNMLRSNAESVAQRNAEREGVPFAVYQLVGIAEVTEVPVVEKRVTFS